jgi:hypothetical protein
MAPPWSIQDTAHKGKIKACCSVDAYAANVIIITLHCWFRLTVQWDDPRFGVCSCQFMGLFLCIFMKGYFDKFIVFLLACIVVSVWLCCLGVH